MAHSKQSAKRIHTNEKARLANKATRSAMKSAVKKVTAAKSREDAQSNLALAMKKVDKAAKKRVIHKNAAARIKRQLSLASARAK
jgi:small subunit ribosomal protein S20